MLFRSEQEHSDTKEKHSELEGRYTGLQERYRNLEQEHSDTKEKHSEFEGRYTGLQERYRDLEQEHSDLQKKCSDLEQEEADLITFKESTVVRNESISQLQGELSEVWHQLRAIKGERDLLMDRVEQLSMVQEDLFVNKSISAEEELKKSRAELDFIRNQGIEVESLREELANKQAMVSKLALELEKALDSLRQNEDIAERNINLMSDIAELNARMKELKMDNETLRSTAASTTEKLQGEITDLQKKAKEENASVMYWRYLHDDVERDRNIMISKVKSLEDDLYLIKLQRDNAKVGMNEMSSRVEQHRARIKELEMKLDESSSVAKLSMEINRLTESCEHLQRDYDVEKEENASLQVSSYSMITFFATIT